MRLSKSENLPRCSFREGQGLSVQSQPTLREAEYHFVKKNYRSALSLCSRMLVEAEPENPEYFQTIVQLDAAIFCIEVDTHDALPRHYSVRFGTNVSDLDQIAAIALQCWHEIHLRHPSDLRGWTHLRPVLDHYSLSRPMPIEFFQIWAKFWELNGRRGVAARWTLHVLRIILLMPYLRKWPFTL